MTYLDFVRRIRALESQSGANATVYNNTEYRVFVAVFRDGTTIHGYAKSQRISVKWGSGHKAFARL